MKTIAITEQDHDNWKFSSNINEVIRAILNFLFLFFCGKILHAQKSPKKHQSAKTQPSKNTKMEISKQK